MMKHDKSCRSEHNKPHLCAYYNQKQHITTSTNTSIFAGTHLEVIRLGKPRKNELCIADEWMPWFSKEARCWKTNYWSLTAAMHENARLPATTLANNELRRTPASKKREKLVNTPGFLNNTGSFEIQPVLDHKKQHITHPTSQPALGHFNHIANRNWIPIHIIYSLC